MSSPMCDRAALVEAMFDGRLGPSERASTERHLKSCSSCVELLHDLTSLQEMLRSSSESVSPLEHQRTRLALLRQTAGPSATKRRPVALLVAALATLPLAVWASASSLSLLRVRDTAPASTAQIAPVTSALGRKEAPTEPVPTASPAPSSTPSSSSAPTPSPPRRARDAPRGKAAAPASTAEASHASQDFAEAMKALSRGDFSAGASKLEGFVSAYPRDPRVEDAAYLEAIALERAGRLEGARVAARRYLAAYPDGAHRTQALRIAGD